MKKLLLLLVLTLGITVQAQFTMNIGVLAGQEEVAPVLDQYYDFDRSALAYMTTDMVLDGETNISILYRGKLLPNGGVESRIYGFDDSHTDLFLVWDDDKVNEFTWQLHDGVTVSNIYESWATDSAIHTFICVYDSAVGVKMYIDGTEVYTSADNDFTGWTTTGNIQLGTKNNAVATSAGLLGTMDRFQVYDRAITQAEVTTLQSDIAGVTSGKIADFGDQKTSTIWTDDVSGYEATNEGDVTLNDY